MENKYRSALRAIIRTFDPEGENRYFQFGSSIHKPYYRDIDIGVVGNARARKRLSRLREAFAESTIPYTVDVVDFDETNKEFGAFIFSHEPVVWIN